MPRPLPDQQPAMRRGRAKTTRPKELEGRPVVYVGHPNAAAVEPPLIKLGLGGRKVRRIDGPIDSRHPAQPGWDDTGLSRTTNMGFYVFGPGLGGVRGPLGSPSGRTGAFPGSPVAFRSHRDLRQTKANQHSLGLRSIYKHNQHPPKTLCMSGARGGLTALRSLMSTGKKARCGDTPTPGLAEETWA
jgi:hypothetical protein